MAITIIGVEPQAIVLDDADQVKRVENPRSKRVFQANSSQTRSDQFDGSLDPRVVSEMAGRRIVNWPAYATVRVSG